jgi:translation initiation factor IF-2
MVNGVVYFRVEDVEKALSGMLEPEVHEVVLGHAKVQAVFKVRQGKVAGCLVTDGVIRRNANVRVLRNGEELFTGRLSSLKRFKDDVPEVRQGFECGIGVDGFGDFQEGDVLESFVLEKK